MSDIYYTFDHVSIIVNNVTKALEFYHDLLGLEINLSRPNLGYPGAWLQVGSQQIHILELENPDPTTNRPEHGGRDRHFALKVNNLNFVIQKLDASNIVYSMSKSGRKALFCRDYDGNAIEIIEEKI